MEISVEVPEKLNLCPSYIIAEDNCRNPLGSDPGSLTRDGQVIKQATHTDTCTEKLESGESVHLRDWHLLPLPQPVYYLQGRSLRVSAPGPCRLAS